MVKKFFLSVVYFKADEAKLTIKIKTSNSIRQKLMLMILSHAHIDHSGNIPNLVSKGFNGLIYATSATVDLCQIMLRDSAHLQEKDIEYVNKKKKKRVKNFLNRFMF
ncbi:MAG: hypothetical protein MZV64_56220 [Ignavibacteriales bacterium]|nr:hypothetical protein [Ignavibacteriales bacterium]